MQQLRYRGSAYTLNQPEILTEPTKTVASFLGQPYPVRHLKNQPMAKKTPSQRLTFFG